MKIPPFSLICLIASSIPSFWYCPGLASRPVSGNTTPTGISLGAVTGLLVAPAAQSPPQQQSRRCQYQCPLHVHSLSGLGLAFHPTLRIWPIPPSLSTARRTDGILHKASPLSSSRFKTKPRSEHSAKRSASRSL